MNAPDILIEARRAGIRLSIADNGKLKFAGSQAALDRLLPAIKAQKADLLARLAATEPALGRHRLFTVIQADGTVLSVSRCPPSTLTDFQADYPECVCAVEQVSETVAVALTPADLALAQAVLHAWGEDDPATIKEWIDGLERDPARLQQMRAQADALGLEREDG